MNWLLIFALGFGAGGLLPLAVDVTVAWAVKMGRTPLLLWASLGAILGVMIESLIGIFLPLKLLNLIPLHERFLLYVLGFGLGVVASSLSRARNR